MEKRIHNIALSILFSLLVWTIIDIFLIAITFWQFIIIQIAIGIGEVFSTFVKRKFGLFNPKDISYLDKNKDKS
jgi:hypothetical protein